MFDAVASTNVWRGEHVSSSYIIADDVVGDVDEEEFATKAHKRTANKHFIRSRYSLAAALMTVFYSTKYY